MRHLKIGLLVFAFLSLVLFSSGCFLVSKFTPEENYLSVREDSGAIPIKWGKSKESDMAALLLPVNLEGIDLPLFMQFDTGAPSTYFHQGAVRSLKEEFPSFQMSVDEEAERVGLRFKLGTTDIRSNQFQIDSRKPHPIDWSNTNQNILLGTIGADILERKVAIIDFKNGICLFADSLAESYKDVQMLPFKFRMRRTLFPAKIAGKKYDLMHDTGTSGFELVSSKSISEKMAIDGSEPVKGFEVRSHDKILIAYNLQTNSSIDFGAVQLPLNKVSYIEGASFWQVALMRMLRMGGMIGNEVFRDKVLIIDGRRKLFGVLD